MSDANGKLFLYDTSTGTETAQVETTGLDVLFPAEISWSDVLDCRIEPFTGRSMEENCHFAEHVRKAYILVSEAQVQDETPPTEA